MVICIPVAFDEDFEAELADSHDTKIEISLLETSLDAELTEVKSIIFALYVLNVFFLFLNIWFFFFKFG